MTNHPFLCILYIEEIIHITVILEFLLVIFRQSNKSMRKDKQKVKIDYSFIFNLFIGIMIFISISNLFAQTTNTLDNKIKVGPTEAIMLGNTSQDTVYHCQFAQDTFTVTNTGDTDLDNIIFGSTDFNGIVDNTYFIPRECIYFTPSYINELPSGSTISVIVNIHVRCGLFAQDYKGKARVMDDDGYPHETIELWITVLPKYDLDISNNEWNLVSNILYLAEIPGNSDSGLFLLINPNTDMMNVDPDSFGNADITNLTYTMTNLTGPGPEIITTNISITPTPMILASGCADTLLYEVDIPEGQISGLYEGMVYVTSPGEDDTGDFFYVNLIVGAEENIDIVETLTSGSGDHASWVDLTTFTVENTGNAELYNLLFNTSGLEGSNYFIPHDEIYLYIDDFWTPVYETSIDELLVGETADVQPAVDVHRGQHAGTYSGFIRVIDDDGYPTDAIVVSLEVFPSYDIDISNIEEDVVGNIMSLYACLGDTTEEKSFLTINPSNDVMNVDPDCFGNADYSVTYLSTDLIFDLDTISSVNVTITPSTSYLLSGGLEVVDLYVTIPSDTILDDGKYFGYITAHADTEGIVVCSDSFRLELNVSSEGVTEWINAVLDSVLFISQNKPNPLNDKTLVKYNLPEDCRVFIKIYDLLGYEIKTLLRVKQKAGMHKVVWDGRDDLGKKVPAGVYFLKVTAGKYTETNKLLKMK